MDLAPLVPRAIRGGVTATTVVMTVLVASVIVGGVLAWQATVAVQQRQAVSDAMLRQYAQLASWEFSREAGQQIDVLVMQTLAAHAHSDRHATRDECDCAVLADVEQRFQISRDGVVSGTALPPALKAAIERSVAVGAGGSMADGVRISQLSDTDPRIVAVRAEPHGGAGGGQIGMVIAPQAFARVLTNTHARAAILPPALVAGRDARSLVDLRVRDRAGHTIFASPGTEPGTPAVDTDLLTRGETGMRVSASMTPVFVAGLGPEHGAGLSQRLVISLVLINALLVGVGVWQLARERELARVRADFVTGVSHELRTPLAQIRMFAETLLLDRIRSPYEGRRALEIIGQETRRLGQLVENILYFHRHQRAPLPPDAQVVDLVPLVRQVVEGFKPLAASRRATVDYQTRVAALLVHANPDGMSQVLLNLLDNAVKFGPPGQTVRVALDISEDQAQLVVEDHGPGIPAADRRRIFKAFERGRATHGAGGAGIGLAVVSQIVGAHGGAVAIEPAATGGARFIISLPVAKDVPLSLAG
jgi:signal transduction histidine kinase